MAALESGTEVGRYRVMDVIGQGAMATVYRALDTRFERIVALKVLRSDLASDSEWVRRFGMEATALARLSHPGIVRLYEFCKADGLAFLALEYVDGVPLDQRLLRVEKLSPEEAAEIVRQVGQALSYAHSQGIIHRDLKPSNILIARDGRVLLSDLGLAMMGGPSLTESGMVLGSPGYMSPEQVRGESLDTRSDIYALGVVLYQMLAGRVPFRGSTLKVVHAQVHETPAPLRTLRPDISRELEKVVLRALCKDPTERYQSVDSLLAELSAVQRLPPLPTTASRPRPAPATISRRVVSRAVPKAQRRPRISLIALAAVLVLLVLAALVILEVRRYVTVPGTGPALLIILAAFLVVALAASLWILLRRRRRDGREAPERFFTQHDMPVTDFAMEPATPMARAAPAQPTSAAWESTDAMPPLPHSVPASVALLRQAPEVASFLVVLNGPQRGQRLSLAKGDTRIGRAPHNDIVIQDHSASRQHACIRLESNQFWIYDYASRNGTFVNGTRIAREQLADRDEIRVGNTNLIFMHIATDFSTDARRRIREFDTVWDELRQAVRRDQ